MKRQVCEWRFSAWAAVLLCAVAIMLPGCGSKPEPLPDTALVRGVQRVDPVALGLDLDRFLSRFYTQVIGDASLIASQTEDRALREFSLRFKIRAAESIDVMEAERDPRRRFVFVWIGVCRYYYSVTEGPNKDMFKAHQDIVVAHAEQAREDIRELARRHFPADEIEEASQEIEETMNKGGFGFLLGQTRLSHEAEEELEKSDTLGSIVGVPLVPITSLQGVASTPQAINNAAGVLADTTDEIGRMPEKTRWQLELLLYEAQDLRLVKDAAENLNRAVATMEEASRTFGGLPAEIRRQLLAAVAEVNLELPEVQKTMAATRETLVEARGVSSELTQTAAAWKDTSESVESLLKTLGIDRTQPKPAVAGQPPREPVTVADINALLKDAQLLAAEVRGVVIDLRETVAADGPVGQVQADAEASAQRVMSAARGDVEAVVDRVMWRGVALIGVAFVAAVAFLIVARVLPRRVA